MEVVLFLWTSYTITLALQDSQYVPPNQVAAVEAGPGEAITKAKGGSGRTMTKLLGVCRILITTLTRVQAQGKKDISSPGQSE